MACPSARRSSSATGATIITRNAYGARCLNTPNVLFADVDADVAVPPWVLSGVGLVSMAVGAYVWRQWDIAVALLAWVLGFIVLTTAVHLLHRAM